MTTAISSPHPPVLVGNILRSLRQGNVNALETALDTAERAHVPSGPGDFAEEMELIQAIASEMRVAVRRSPAGVPQGELEAYLPLLRNLAGRPRLG